MGLTKYLIPVFLPLLLLSCKKPRQTVFPYFHPQIVPIKDANPNIRHPEKFILPFRVEAKQVEEDTVYYFDSTSFEEVSLSVGENMIIGVCVNILISKDGAISKVPSLLTGGSTDLKQILINQHHYNMPARFRNNSIEAFEISVFETDMPASSPIWRMGSEKFKVLWVDTLQVDANNKIKQ